MQIKNENLQKLIDKLYTDKDVLYRFIQHKSEEELYEYALTIYGGYTKQEFFEALSSVINESEISYRNSHPNRLYDLSSEETRQISGGGVSESFDELYKSVISTLDGIKKGWDFGALIKKVVVSIRSKIKK